MRLRQIALVARDLEPVVEDFHAVLGIEVAHRDPEVRIFGLRNAVMPIGDTFLEIASPTSEDTAAGRSRTFEFYGGIDLSRPKGWRTLQSAIDLISEGVLSEDRGGQAATRPKRKKR